MGDLEAREDLRVVPQVEPAGASEAGVGLVETGIVLVGPGLYSGLQVEAVLRPQGVGAHRRLGRRGDVGLRAARRREHVAVEQRAAGDQRIEHPRSGADSDGLVAWLHALPHRLVLRSEYGTKIRVRQIRK